MRSVPSDVHAPDVREIEIREIHVCERRDSADAAAPSRPLFFKATLLRGIVAVSTDPRDIPHPRRG